MIGLELESGAGVLLLETDDPLWIEFDDVALWDYFTWG